MLPPKVTTERDQEGCSTTEWLRIGEKTIEIRPRPDDRDGKQLSALLNLYFGCERAREVRLLSVHAAAFASALALTDRILDALPVLVHRNLELGWSLVVLWTAMVAGFECYRRWRWKRFAERYLIAPVEGPV